MNILPYKFCSILSNHQVAYMAKKQLPKNRNILFTLTHFANNHQGCVCISFVNVKLWNVEIAERKMCVLRKKQKIHCKRLYK